jgi:hypothetical protein
MVLKFSDLLQLNIFSCTFTPQRLFKLYHTLANLTATQMSANSLLLKCDRIS